MKRVRLIILGCALVGISVLALSFCRKEGDSAKVVLAARHDTVWKERGVLFLRYESEGSGTMLLKHLTTEEDRDRRYAEFGHTSTRTPATTARPVYRFTPTVSRLEQAEAGAWDQATSAVVDCGIPTTAVSPFTLDMKNDTLTYSGSVVRTRGRTVQSIVGSPDGKWVAVLSVDGRRFPSPMPFLGRGRVMGTRYHQFFSRAHGKQAGETVRLPFDDVFDTSRPCWSADARYLVYSEVSFYFLTVIEAPESNSAEDKP